MSDVPQEGPRPQPVRALLSIVTFFAASGCAVFVAQPDRIIPTGMTTSIPWFDGERKVLDQDDLQLGMALLGLALLALAVLLKPKR